jgi:YD repeat-containing protein
MLHFKDGSRLKYAQEEYIASETFYQLSEVIDPAGHKLTLHYTDSKVTSITDADGNSTTLEYDLEFYPWVTKVTTPDGREAQLMYDLGGMLTNIVDAAGISSSLSYDGFGWVSALATPYGTTYFNCGFSVSGLDRWAQITELVLTTSS